MDSIKIYRYHQTVMINNLIKPSFGVAQKLMACSFIILLVLLTANDAVSGSKDCRISRPIISAPIEDFIKVGECSVEKILEANNFGPDDGEAFLARAAQLYPKSDLIIRFEKLFQSRGESLMMLRFTSTLENYELTLALSEMHFNRVMNKREHAFGHDESDFTWLKCRSGT